MNESESSPLIPVRKMGISIAVASLENMSKWYGEQLGFQVTLRRDFPEYKTRIAFIEVGDQRIEFIEDAEFEPMRRSNPPHHTTTQGVSQITFEVDDLDALIAKVKARPIEIAWDKIVVADIHLQEFFIRDIEGNLLQFVQWLKP